MKCSIQEAWVPPCSGLWAALPASSFPDKHTAQGWRKLTGSFPATGQTCPLSRAQAATDESPRPPFPESPVLHGRGVPVLTLPRSGLSPDGTEMEGPASVMSLGAPVAAQHLVAALASSLASGVFP